MLRVTFEGKEFEFANIHEATCAALFSRYGWRWEKPESSVRGWWPDFVLKGKDGTKVYVECKGSLKWDSVPHFSELTRYEDAVIGTSGEVLLIPEAPQRMENAKGYPASILGFLYDGSIWSHAELSRWSGRVGFCHAANSWKDRMSGENVHGSMGDGQRPDIEDDWLSAKLRAQGKRASIFRASSNSPTEEWTAQ